MKIPKFQPLKQKPLFFKRKPCSKKNAMGRTAAKAGYTLSVFFFNQWIEGKN